MITSFTCIEMKFNAILHFQHCIEDLPERYWFLLHKGEWNCRSYSLYEANGRHMDQSTYFCLKTTIIYSHDWHKWLVRNEPKLQTHNLTDWDSIVKCQKYAKWHFASIVHVLLKMLWIKFMHRCFFKIICFGPYCGNQKTQNQFRGVSEN